MKACVISLSGGTDSSSLLASVLNEYPKVFAFAFDYGQRHIEELTKCKKLVEFLGSQGFDVSLEILDVRDVFSSSQSALGANKAMDVPKEEYDQGNLRATVVENRNVIFSAIIYGKALAISKKYDVDVDIMLGVHANDNTTYPDCRPESVNMAKELYRISNYGSERIDYKAPFVTMTKQEVLKQGIISLLHLDISPSEFYANTSSCYDPITVNGEPYACGKCATCLDRLNAFFNNGMDDPIKYQ